MPNEVDKTAKAGANFDEIKRCCTVCDAKKVCHICGAQTLWACSDCAIDLSATIHVCPSKDCRNAHEEKCPARLRSRLFGISSVSGYSHSTACSIWGDDGQGLAAGFVAPFPCNCGALLNWEKKQAADLREQLAAVTQERDALWDNMMRLGRAKAREEREGE